jgi:hypothetical protein
MTAQRTAQADQFHAAARDARRHLDAIAAHGRATVHQSTDPTGWLLAQAARFVAALTATTARVCPHVGTSPRVVHAAVWAPGIVVCPACTHLLTPTPTEDTICDRCRRTVPAIYAATVALGPLLLAYGLCDPCQTAAGLAAPAAAPSPARNPPRRHQR